MIDTPDAVAVTLAWRDQHLTTHQACELLGLDIGQLTDLDIDASRLADELLQLNAKAQ